MKIPGLSRCSSQADQQVVVTHIINNDKDNTALAVVELCSDKNHENTFNTLDKVLNTISIRGDKACKFSIHTDIDRNLLIETL